jgi:TRAP-type mannitol/chloroaromatic compound transport system permease large subunit
MSPATWNSELNSPSAIVGGLLAIISGSVSTAAIAIGLIIITIIVFIQRMKKKR